MIRPVYQIIAEFCTHVYIWSNILSLFVAFKPNLKVFTISSRMKCCRPTTTIIYQQCIFYFLTTMKARQRRYARCCVVVQISMFFFYQMCDNMKIIIKIALLSWLTTLFWQYRNQVLLLIYKRVYVFYLI